ncbi:hypothetical protein BJV85_002773 [Clostridium acetobutylicum]|uniref:hypothetical protein n=1 Tax=Clostridium acetobutylicum TaxID=1488 RepID=UPI000200A69B|nr:hypothetical protein [Clostridium acetobutylicum]ADZ20274.1 DNA/RNA helicase, SNF2 [Clostridium acetobutylicum EA 2018]AEI31724.1 DNA/RNA helicase, SNF2 [Clostridium acetobutylicum DSM 1731]PSM04839.1 DNA helicase [Clostridium sp. NJ4]AWV81554.1 DNA helicase [Clostridium acetobutylicum]MBC2393194.1 DNA helicase [Clostridium acetobutylicum]
MCTIIRKKERYFIRHINKRVSYADRQKIKRTTYYLFWVIPIFIKDEIVGGDYEI